MVEFAVSVMLLLPLFIGMFEFGYMFNLYNRLSAAVRNGARYASILTYDSATETPSDSFLAAVRNAVIYGSPSGGLEPVVPGLNPENIDVSVSMQNSKPDMITVSISGFQVDTIFKTFTWSEKPSVAFRFEGVFAP